MGIINEIRGKNALILGFGREGKSTVAFLRRYFPCKIIGVADSRAFTQLEEDIRQSFDPEQKVELFLGQDYLKNLADYDIIFKSPGIPPFLPEIIAARRAGKTITSNTELFFEICPGTIIGVTGTKGKSTTASLIYETLKTTDADVRLIGNIGIPPLSTLDGASPRTIFVMELSSYQLCDLKKSPQISVIQDIVQEHLDYHQTFDAYVEAKRNIVRYQSVDDYLIFNASSPILRKIANESISKKLAFGDNQDLNSYSFLDDNFLVYRSNHGKERIIQIEAIPLKGGFNLQNVMPAIIVGKLFGVSTEGISAAIRDFKPLEHRLEFVRTYNGISFYNDGLATVPEATIGAIEAFPMKNIILLCGGFDRGQDFTGLCRMILTSNIKAVILFPTTGKRIRDELFLQTKNKGHSPLTVFVTNMHDGVQMAYNMAEMGDIILLSPASPSFGCFRDYEERGNRFKEEVLKISL